MTNSTRKKAQEEKNRNRVNARSVEEAREFIKKEILESPEKFLLFYSGRGIGKTYTTQKTILEKIFEEKTELGFVVLKDKEIKSNALRLWLEKVLQNEFSKKYDFKFDKENGYFSEKSEKRFIPFCRCFSIVSADDYKVKSYPNVRFLVWDECVKARTRPEDERAMYNFLSIYETIDREENRVKAICLCNVLKTAKTSPVFDYFKVPFETLPNDIHTDGQRKAVYLPIFETDKDFAKGVKDYAGMSRGIFERPHYGDLIRTPDKDERAEAVVVIRQSEDFYFAIMQTQKNLYVEYIDKIRQIELFRVYVLNPADVTSELRLVPPNLKRILLNAYLLGKLKFINEESILRSKALQTFIYGKPFID